MQPCTNVEKGEKARVLRRVIMGVVSAMYGLGGTNFALQHASPKITLSRGQNSKKLLSCRCTSSRRNAALAIECDSDWESRRMIDRLGNRRTRQLLKATHGTLMQVVRRLQGPLPWRLGVPERARRSRECIVLGNKASEWRCVRDRSVCKVEEWVSAGSH